MALNSFAGVSLFPGRKVKVEPDPFAESIEEPDLGLEDVIFDDSEDIPINLDESPYFNDDIDEPVTEDSDSVIYVAPVVDVEPVIHVEPVVHEMAAAQTPEAPESNYTLERHRAEIRTMKANLKDLDRRVTKKNQGASPEIREALSAIDDRLEELGNQEPVIQVIEAPRVEKWYEGNMLKSMGVGVLLGALGMGIMGIGAYQGLQNHYDKAVTRLLTQTHGARNRQTTEFKKTFDEGIKSSSQFYSAPLQKMMSTLGKMDKMYTSGNRTHTTYQRLAKTIQKEFRDLKRNIDDNSLERVKKNGFLEKLSEDIDALRLELEWDRRVRRINGQGSYP